MRGLLLCSIITASLLVGLLFVIGLITKPWDGNFVHEDMPKCYDSGLYNFLNTFWRPELDPAIDYIPYFNLYANVDCTDYSLNLRQRAIPDLVQCGLTHYRSGNDNVKTLSWAYGPEHHSEKAPGSAKGANWNALSSIGKSFEAPTGHMIGLFELKEPGTLRDPHWHSNAAEFSYIIRGTARVTVTGLPYSNMEGTSRLQDERSSETFLVGPGDAFYSPVGYHHYFESVNPNEPLYGIAIFDTADLKSFDTPQMMKTIPTDILSQVLNLPKDEVDNMYRGFRRVFVDPHKDWSGEGIDSDKENSSDKKYRFKVNAMDKDLINLPRSDYNGNVRTKSVDALSHPELNKSRFSFAYTEIEVGATLEPYWVDNADEIVYVLEGSDIEVIRSGNGKKDCRDEFTIEEGYLALSEIGSSWLMKNNGEKPAKLLRIFNSNKPSRTTLYDAYYSLPGDVKKTMLQPKYFNQYDMPTSTSQPSHVSTSTSQQPKDFTSQRSENSLPPPTQSPNINFTPGFIIAIGFSSVVLILGIFLAGARAFKKLKNRKKAVDSSPPPIAPPKLLTVDHTEEESTSESDIDRESTSESDIDSESVSEFEC